MANSYKDLIAWKKAMALVSNVYRSTKGFPRDEMFGLTIQLRRAAVSIPNNIAEGQSRFSRPEFRYFLRTARGSLSELETQLLIALDLRYIKPAQSDRLLSECSELGRILNGLIASTSATAASAGQE